MHNMGVGLLDMRNFSNIFLFLTPEKADQSINSSNVSGVSKC